MKRNYFIALLALIMITPFVSIKAQLYDAGDSTACYNIMTNNFSSENLLNWNDPDPGMWLGVTWNSATPKRIIEFLNKLENPPVIIILKDILVSFLIKLMILSIKPS